ncbi:uncharacterized protein [Gossypium hirsutum]|uniref:CCHC-type domain-containing protein n=1 Tax=Gossypium hirsutum TaxID=3635 RepID=A0ABM2Z729_GOSHI|nr:uncharacterized protein LOC121209993 [Gossypium hirsutum]
MFVSEYEREFVRLRKYARDYVSTEEIMCKWHSSRDRGKQFSSPKGQAISVSSLGSVRNNKPEFQHCGRLHFGECWNKSNKACYKCGLQDHFIWDCPELVEKDNIQNGRPGNTTIRGRLPRNAGNTSGNHGTMRDSTVSSEARAPARAYAIRACEEASSPDVITDIGSTHLYIASTVSMNLGISAESTVREIFVISPIESNSEIGSRYRDCYVSEHRDYLSNVISALVAEKLIQKGCEAYLALPSNYGSAKLSIRDILTVKDFPNVSPKELSRIPLNREVEFGIELLPGIAPVSISPYCMAPNELMELKAQMQELLN